MLKRGCVKDAIVGERLWYNCPDTQAPREGVVMQVVPYGAIVHYILEIYCVIDFAITLKSQYQVRRNKDEF